VGPLHSPHRLLERPLADALFQMLPGTTSSSVNRKETDMRTARRDLLRVLITLGASSALNACSKTSGISRIASFGALDHRGQGPADMRPWARYPEKADLIMLADRPPLLETPMRYFTSDLTPNDVYFVRWHYAGLPTHVDSGTCYQPINDRCGVYGCRPYLLRQLRQLSRSRRAG
jgi:hypothetical protein